MKIEVSMVRMVDKKKLIKGVVKGAAAVGTLGGSLAAEKVAKVAVKKVRKEEDPADTSKDPEETVGKDVEEEQEILVEENLEFDEQVDEQESVGATSPDPHALDQLKALSDLHAAGALSDEEFEAKKQDLLKRI